MRDMAFEIAWSKAIFGLREEMIFPKIPLCSCVYTDRKNSHSTPIFVSCVSLIQFNPYETLDQPKGVGL